MLISQVRFNAALHHLHPFPCFRLGLVAADRIELVSQILGNIYDVSDFFIRDRGQFSVAHTVSLCCGNPVCEQSGRMGSLFDGAQAPARNGSVIGVAGDAGAMEDDECVRKKRFDLAPNNEESPLRRQFRKFPVRKMVDLEG